MLVIFTFFFFALGAIIASFLGVVSERWNTGESWFYGRSHCDSCTATLSSRDLVPVFSWLFIRGRCRFCGSRVSARSTIAEILLGALFVLAYLKLGITLSLVFMIVALAFLMLIVLYDLRHTLVPGVFSVPFVFASVFFAISNAVDIREFGFIFLTSAGIALVLSVLHFASHGRAMGLADTPITFGLALLTGPLAFSGFIYSFWIGAIVGIIILLRTPAGHRIGIEVPFAPFLATGFLLAYFTGWNVFNFII